MSIRLRHFVLCALMVLIACAAAWSADGGSFDEKVDYVRRLPAGVSTADRLAAFEQIITEFQGDPRTSSVMRICGHLVVAKDKEGGLNWFRRAMKTASPGSKTWFDSRFDVLGRISLTSPEADTILDEIVRNSDRNSIHAARVVGLRLQGRIQRADVAGAEKTGRELLNWYSDHAPAPSGDKSDVDRQMITAANLLLEMYVHSPAPKADRRSRIDALQDEFSHLHWLPQYCDMARDRLQKLPESHIEPLKTAQGTHAKPTGPSINRMWVIGGNVAAILVLVTIVRIWRSRS